MSKKKKGARTQVILKSSENVQFVYSTVKKKVVGHKLALKKYHPTLRKHVLFTESK